MGLDERRARPLSLAFMAAGDWTDAENDLIVADYFAMLIDDLAGKSFNKAASYRRLDERIELLPVSWTSG